MLTIYIRDQTPEVIEKIKEASVACEQGQIQQAEQILYALTGDNKITFTSDSVDTPAQENQPA